jgi:fluoride exporter
MSPSAAGYACVALGSALGGVTRFWLSNVTAQAWGGNFPWGTIIINVSGSFAIGLFAGLTGTPGRQVDPRLAQFFVSGVCGGYTTFSAFSLQTLQLARQSQWMLVAANVLLSVVCCLLAVWLGWRLGQLVND